MHAHDKRQGGPKPSFDAVVDLESVVKDPNAPDWAMNRALAATDLVHPNQAGCTAIANAFPLEIFYGGHDDDDCHHDR